MILVQNHRQRLSGNSFLWLTLFFSAFVSCGAISKNVVKDPGIEQPKEPVVIAPSKPEKEETPKEVRPLQKDVFEKVMFKGETFEVKVHPKDFNIVILLPFHTGAKTREDRFRAEYMLEFYHGVQLATAYLETLGSTYHFTVLDTKNDTNELKQLLKKPILEQADLIIGPTSENQVREVAYFARKHKIPVFSPITTIENNWSDNPYLFNVSVSEKAKAQVFLAYLKKNHPNKRIVLIRDAVSKFDKGFGDALATELNKGINKNFRITSHSNYMRWSELLDPSNQTIIVHTSLDKMKLNFCFNSLRSNNAKVVLFGSDKWLNFSNIDYSFVEKLNVHYITDRTDLGNNQGKSQDFRTQFRKQFKGDAPEFTIKGYDLCVFAGEILNAFGPYFPEFIPNKKFEYQSSAFYFKKIDGCFHNASFNLLHYNNGELTNISLTPQ